MFNNSDVLVLGVSDNRLQFKSPSKYSSRFSASIISIVFSNNENKLLDEFGGLYQVPTKKGRE